MGQGIGAGLPLLQDVAGFLEFIGVEKFVAFEREAHRLVEHQDIRQQWVVLQTFDVLTELVQSTLQLRANVCDELKYTTKGKRGAGKTYEAILIRISNARRDHTASIRRQREWKEAL